MYDYEDLVKTGYEEKIENFRFYVSRKSIKLGDDVMPHDVSEIMTTADNSGKYKNLLFNGFTSAFGKMLLMIDIYEGLGDSDIPFEYKELTISNLKNYF